MHLCKPQPSSTACMLYPPISLGTSSCNGHVATLLHVVSMRLGENPEKLPCRSNTVAVGYLMKLRRWRLADSFQWVKQRRPKMQLSAGEASL